jgi:hypothetical protein
MNKREILHMILDKVLDIQETTGMCPQFSYQGHVNSVQLHILASPERYREWMHDDIMHFYFSDYELSPKILDAFIDKINVVKNTPIPEPKINIQITEEKAKELGLIA